MDIEKIFSKDEFRRLVLLTYLGEWIINSQKRPVNSSVEYNDVLDKVLGYAQKIGLNEYVQRKKNSQEIEASFFLEEEGVKIMEEYHDHFFLEELVERFSQVDVEAFLSHRKKGLSKAGF